MKTKSKYLRNEFGLEISPKRHNLIYNLNENGYG